MKTLFKHIFFALCAFTSAQVNAQSDPVTEPCGSGLLHEQLLESDPHYAREIWNLERKLGDSSNIIAERGGEILSIPTVVHIVHEGEPIGQGSNITDEQIFSAIVALNEDFRKAEGSNGDGAGVDVGIEFCLASRDPQGNSSNGIVRVNGSSVENYAEMGISAVNGNAASEAAVKALSTWPKAEYLNIWIVNEIENNDAGNGIQGYAYFPTVSNLDGIVLLHNVFGTTGNLKPSANMNRTTTHEAGHYLALYHTFHNTNSCSEVNCATSGDRVCDTPATTLNNSCNSPACGGTQQVENYMDYTDQNCRDMFSQGQSDRMRATLLSDRSSLLSSLGCIPVTSLDAGVTAIHSPSGSLCSAQINSEISITNFGSNTLNSVNIEYGYLGGTVHASTWNGSLVSGNSTQIALPAFTSGNGNQTFYARIAGVNGGNDEYDGNDQMQSGYVIASGAGISIVFTVDYFGSETTWELFDTENNLMASGGPYIDNNQGAQFTENVCLSEGCYALTVYDEYGDGMGFTSGNFQIYDNSGNSLGGATNNFGPEVTVEFCAVPDVIEGEPPTASFSMNSDEICRNGSVDFNNLSTGDGNTYSWVFSGANPSNSAQVSPQNISYPNTGTFNVTLTASNAFGTDSETMTVTVHPAPSLTMSSNNISCNGAANGSANALASGNGPFSYDWSNGGSSSSINNLTPGTYNVTVSDLNECTASGSVAIAQPPVMSLTLNPTAVSCFGENDGSIQPSVGGGNGGNSYSWSNGAQTASLSGISAGNYTLTVTDNQGCSKSASASVTEPGQLQLNLQTFDISCGIGTGSAQVNPQGGTPPYTVNWSNGTSGLNSGSLGAGNYSVNLTDANDCSTTENFSISSGSSLSVVIEIENTSCSGLNDGSALAIPGGGSAPFSFEWNTGTSSDQIEGLSPGTYSVSVTDSQGCSGSADVQITAPSPLVLELSLSNSESCALNDGEVQASASGGVEPYSFEWSNGIQDPIAGGLSASNYSATVTDANGCADIATINVPFDCAQLINGPALTDSDCGAIGFEISDQISCEIVEDAQMYLWRFENDAAGILTEEYTLGGNNTFQLSNLPGLIYGITVEVRVKAMINDEWTAFGNPCFITMELLVPSTQLTDEDCGLKSAYDGMSLHCDAVSGADLYEWRFMKGSQIILLDSYLPQVTVSLNDGFELSEVYEVRVRATVGEQTGEWGTPCDFGFNAQVGIGDLPKESSTMSFYPNPSNGSNLFFDLQNLSETDDVIDLELYNTNGQLIEKFALYYPGRSSLTTEHQFKSKLSAGMYFLKYSLTDEVMKEKLIVR